MNTDSANNDAMEAERETAVFNVVPLVFEVPPLPVLLPPAVVFV